MTNKEWSDLRSRLHHDWLQLYFPRLIVWREAIDATAQGKGILDVDISERFLEWREKRKMFSDFIESAEEALSPRQLLSEPPLSAMPPEDKKWLGEVIHHLYLERTAIRQKVSSLDTFLGGVNSAFEDIVNRKSINTSPSGHLSDSLTEFSQAISALPHSIQVV